MNELDLVQQQFSVLDHVPIGVMLLKQDHTVLFWNSCLESWSRIPKALIIGTDLRAHFPHLDAPKFADRLRDIFAGGPPTIFSAQIHGHVLPVRLWNDEFQVQQTTVTALPSLSKSGYYALFALQDVTDLTHRIRNYRIMRDQALAEVAERKRIEEKLIQVQEELEDRVKERTADLIALNTRLQTEITERKHAGEELKKLLSALTTLVEHIPEGVVLLDGECRIILSNAIGQAYLRTLSVTGTGEILSHISGTPVKDLILDGQTAPWHEFTIESPFRRIFQIGGSSIGRPEADEGMVLVIKDVTEEKSRQERLFTQERLAAVGQLAAGIAHDFNNILTGIIGFTEVLLADGHLRGSDQEVLETVRQSGLRAGHLIRQILDFSRRSSTEMRPIEMAAFMNDFSKFIRRTIQENVRISYDLDPGEYIVHADPAKLQQVFTNLALNARDAMPHGGDLTFSLARRAVLQAEKLPVPDMPDGDWIALTVTDTGCGIPQEVLPHIFEPFFTTKDTGKGTGLGLSQVYGIIKQHGGFMDVQSEVGTGSSFVVYLPACEATLPEAIPEQALDIFDGKSAGILVVEDYEAIRVMIEKILTKLNFTVFTAKNGREALQIYEKHRNSIQLIITDLVMPEMDGIGLSRIIKKNNPSVKILAITGYPLGSKWEELYKAGITECILKPFERPALIHTVCTLLNKTV